MRMKSNPGFVDFDQLMTLANKFFGENDLHVPDECAMCAVTKTTTRQRANRLEIA